MFVASLLLPVLSVINAAERGTLLEGCPANGPLLLNQAGVPRVLDGHTLANRTSACVAPKFPAVARQLRFEGSVVVGVLVNEAGRVACARLVSGHPLMTGSAIEAARQWTFRPATQRGRAVSFYGALAFHYSTSGTGKKAGSCMDAHW